MATPPKYPPERAPIANQADQFRIDRTWLLYLNGLAAQAAAAGSGDVTHTGTLTAEHLLLGNGGADIKALAAVGTSTTVLHGNASGAPTFSPVDLAADVTGDLPLANLSPAGAASELLGRGSAAGSGDWQAITLGAGVAMTGTVLSATGSGGTVTSVTATSPLTSSGGATPDIAIADTAVTPGTYGDATHVGQFTVDAKGRVTFAQDVAITGSGSGSWIPLVTGSEPPAFVTDGAGHLILVAF